MDYETNIENDLDMYNTYSTFFSLTERLLKEAYSLISYKQNDFNIEEYNTAQKLVFRVLNEPYSKDLFGKDRYSMVLYHGALAIHDNQTNKNETSLGTLVPYEILENKKFLDSFVNTINIVKEKVETPNVPTYERMNMFNKAGKIDIFFNDLDNEYYNSFKIKSEIVQKLSKPENLKFLIMQKLNNENDVIKVEKSDFFVEHYQKLTKNSYLNILEETDVNNEKFANKFLHSLMNDFGYRNVVQSGIDESNDEMLFFSVSVNGKTVGGTTVFERNNYFEINNIDVVAKYDNVDFIKKSLQEIVKNLPSGISIICNMERKETSENMLSAIKEFNNESEIKIYSSPNEVKAFKELNKFYELNNISEEDRKIISSEHFAEIIKNIENNPDVNKFYSEKLESYGRPENISNIDRKSFLEKAMYKTQDEKSINDYFMYDRNFIRKGIDIENTNEPLKNIEKTVFEITNNLLISMNIYLDLFQKEALKDNIEKNITTARYEARHEYNFNHVYDFLCEENIIKTKAKTKIYRLEANDNKLSSQSTSLYKQDTLKGDKERNYIHNLYDRRGPVSEKGLNYVFHKDNAQEGFCQEWFFAFKNKEQLTRWLDEESLKTLNQGDVKIGIYEVDNNMMMESRRQVIFKKEKSKKISQENIFDFLENDISKPKTKRKIKIQC